MSGYTQTELDDVQAKWALRFPADLIALYRHRRYVIDNEDERFRSFDWITAPDETIRDALEWPFVGFLFDVKHGLWWPEWGEKPSDESSQEEKLRAIFSLAPKLIPLCGHRYIPEEPHEAGNPVFSVWQMDVIYYGADLADYIRRENGPSAGGSCPDSDVSKVREIRFWTRAVDFNEHRFTEQGGFAFLNRNSILPES